MDLPLFVVYLNNQHNPFITYTDTHVGCKYCDSFKLNVIKPYKRVEHDPLFLEHVFRFLLQDPPHTSKCKLATEVYKYINNEKTVLNNAQKVFVNKIVQNMSLSSCVHNVQQEYNECYNSDKSSYST